MIVNTYFKYKGNVWDVWLLFGILPLYLKKN